jgi:hypothetical protein
MRVLQKCKCQHLFGGAGQLACVTHAAVSSARRDRRGSWLKSLLGGGGGSSSSGSRKQQAVDVKAQRQVQRICPCQM